MKGDKIYYRDGFKYQLAEDYRINVAPILPLRIVFEQFLKLDLLGNLIIKAGYAWDGPSGPTVDTPDSMRGSLVHDALYQLMREGHLDPALHREPADHLLRQILLEDGMPHIRAQAWYEGVRLGGASSASPANQKPVLEAPRPSERGGLVPPFDQP